MPELLSGVYLSLFATSEFGTRIMNGFAVLNALPLDGDFGEQCNAFALSCWEDPVPISAFVKLKVVNSGRAADAFKFGLPRPHSWQNCQNQYLSRTLHKAES